MAKGLGVGEVQVSLKIPGKLFSGDAGLESLESGWDLGDGSLRKKRW